jgi:hypothetical protein
MFKVYIVGKWGKREEVAKFKTREEAERFASKIKEYMRSGLEGLRVEIEERPGFDLDRKTATIVALLLIATFIGTILSLSRGRG